MLVGVRSPRSSSTSPSTLSIIIRSHLGSRYALLKPFLTGLQNGMQENVEDLLFIIQSDVAAYLEWEDDQDKTEDEINGEDEMKDDVRSDGREEVTEELAYPQQHYVQWSGNYYHILGSDHCVGPPTHLSDSPAASGAHGWLPAASIADVEVANVSAWECRGRENEQQEPQYGDGGSEYCEVCEMWLNGPIQMEDHKNGKKHRTNVRKSRTGLGTSKQTKIRPR